MTDLEKGLNTSELDPILTLESFIKDGLGLIKSGSFEAAISHFNNPHVAKSLGYRLSQSPLLALVRVSIVNIDEIGPYVDFCAQNSFFDDKYKARGDFPQISLSTVDIPKHILIKSKPEIILELMHNIALIHAEEWVHGLQKRKGQLGGNSDTDIDVAVYLFNEGVPLTNEFLSKNGRSEVIRKLKNN